MAYVLVPSERLVDVARGELIQLLVVSKDDDSDVYGAKDAELVGLFEEPTLAFEKRPVNSRSVLNHRAVLGTRADIH